MAVLPFDTHKLIEICRQNDITKIGVFGSIVRGEATSHSDIDMLVYFSKPKSLLKVVALERQISKSLGRKVDLTKPKRLALKGVFNNSFLYLLDKSGRSQ